ncbi:MAG: ATP-binding protein, partial [Chitinophagaceae bacterium]|nr:ATP-binding protein [Chitinophagaceae bacterium]
VLLSIIIHNLLDNSQKACANGNVIITSEAVGEEILLTVADSGTGFPAHILEWLNEEQLEKAHDDVSHGLGLYIVKDLMRMLKIRARPVNSNNGATITLFLKRAHIS